MKNSLKIAFVLFIAIAFRLFKRKRNSPSYNKGEIILRQMSLLKALQKL
jgi:hypothetical protein